jgi:predicted SAM-dependent methyltransferase
LTKVFLHVGCGGARQENTTPGFAGPEWKELRVDIDPAAQPDFVCSITDMKEVASESVDALYSSHNIEHLYAHEVPLALQEFRRVLRPDGFAVITCPDLQSVAALIAADQLIDTAYVSPAGPIAPLDILYGHRASIAAGNLFMAHHCGFTSKVLGGTLLQTGFHHAAMANRAAPHFDLWALAAKGPMDEVALRALATQHFPRQPVA